MSTELIQKQAPTEIKRFFNDYPHDQYTPHVKQFLAWLGPRDLDMDAIKDYIRQLNASSLYKNGSKRVKRQALKHRCRMYVRTADIRQKMAMKAALEDLDEDPETKCPKTVKARVGAEKIVNNNEYLQLLHHARSARQTAFIKFLYKTGCRVSELCGLRLQDIFIENGWASLRVIGKGNKERIVFITEQLYSEIRNIFRGEMMLYETSNGKPYDPTYISRQIAKIGRRALHRRISAHTLRHSFATRKYAETRKVQALSEYLGHASVSTFLGYYTHEELTKKELLDDDDLV